MRPDNGSENTFIGEKIVKRRTNTYKAKHTLK